MQDAPAGIPLDRAGGVLKGTFQIIVVTAFWGGYTLLMPVSAFILLRRNHKSRAHVILLIVTCFMYAISTSFWGILVANSLNLLKAQFARSEAPGLNEVLVSSARSLRTLRLVQSWPRIINFTIGDVIVLWRCLMLYRSKVVKYASIVLIVTSAIVSVYDGIRNTLDARNLFNVVNTNVNKNLDSIAVSLSFATNLFATALIFRKTWLHRQFIIKNMGQSKPTGRVERILIILLESSVFYCILQAIAIVMNALPMTPNSGLDIGSSTYLAGLNIISGFYLTLLVCLVASERYSSVHVGSDVVAPSVSQGTLILSRMRFANAQDAYTNASNKSMPNV